MRPSLSSRLCIVLAAALLAACAPSEPTPVLRELEAERLKNHNENTTGVLNTTAGADGKVYRAADDCYVRRFGSANEATPMEPVQCPNAMKDAAWDGCLDGEIYRDEEGSCVCHTMSAPNGSHPRSLAQAGVDCPMPALLADVITVPS